MLQTKRFPIHRAAGALAGLLAVALIAKSQSITNQDSVRQTGPLGLIIQYYCPTEKRAGFRQEAVRSLQNFEKLSLDGTIGRYHLMFSRYVDTNSWDAMALIEFSNYEAVRHWKEVEIATPAGLNREALALTSRIETYQTDLVRSAESAATTPDPVYLIIPYSLAINTDAYIKYTDDYVIPQFQGWMREGILAGFQLFMQRYTASRPWDSMIFLRYRNDAALGRREQVVNKMRAELANNPTWKAISDSKQTIRTEKQAIIADDLAVQETRKR